jgi:hypothetical protein
MIGVVIGVCGAEGGVGAGEGEVEGVVDVDGVGEGSAEEEKKEDTRPRIGVACRLAMPTGV